MYRKIFYKFPYKTAMVFYLFICCMSYIIILGLMAEVYFFGLRYHFNKDCSVVQWSGDNPNSVAGVRISSLTYSTIYL